MTTPNIEPSIKAESLSGPIGARVQAVWEGNLKKINWEQDFLEPFRAKSAAQPGMGNRPDPLLWLAPDPIGVGRAPGT